MLSRSSSCLFWIPSSRKIGKVVYRFGISSPLNLSKSTGFYWKSLPLQSRRELRCTLHVYIYRFSSKSGKLFLATLAPQTIKHITSDLSTLPCQKHKRVPFSRIYTQRYVKNWQAASVTVQLFLIFSANRMTTFHDYRCNHLERLSQKL